MIMICGGGILKKRCQFLVSSQSVTIFAAVNNT